MNTKTIKPPSLFSVSAFQRVSLWLLLLSAFQLFSFSAFGVTTNVVTVTVTFTNAAGTTNGQTFAISNSANPNYTYTWTNAGTPAFKRLATTNSPAKAATNLYSRLTNDWTSQSLRFSFGSPTSVVLRTLGYADLSAAVSTNPAYAIVTILTNTAPTNSTLVVSNVTAKAITFWDGTSMTTAASGSSGSGTNYTIIKTNLDFRLGLITNGTIVFDPTNATAMAQLTDVSATLAAQVAGDLSVSNMMVSFTITTNLSYTNSLGASLASNNNFNGTYVWTVSRYLGPNGSTTKFITNNGGAFIFGSSAAPNTPTAFTNDTLTGQYDTNGLQSTPPYVFYPSNAVITTNWFIAGQSYKLPLTSINAEDFGVRGDAVKLYAATVAAGALICTNSAFTSNDVGKSFVMYLTSTNTDYVLGKIVAFNNATNVTLSTNFTQSTAYEAWYFTDNSAANSNALNSFTGDGVMNYTGQYGTLYGFATAAVDAASGRYAVINIPTDRSTGIITNTSRTIVIRGQTPAMIYPSFINAGGVTSIGSPNTGTILFNFAKPVANATNAFVYHDGTSAGGSQFARERVVWQNITLRQPGLPTHHGMFLQRAGTTYLKDFTLDVDMSANWLNATSGLPPFYMEGIVSNANSIRGVWGPSPYNYAGIILDNVALGYHGTLLESGEHTTSSGRVSLIAGGCGQYLDGAIGTQGTWNGCKMLDVYLYLCQYRIVVSTNSTLREKAWYGNLGVEEGFPRADIGPLVYDPLKRLRLVIGCIDGNGVNTTIESTNGSWYNSINDSMYLDGVTVSNGVMGATSFTGSGSGLTDLNASALTSGTVPNVVLTNLNRTNLTLVNPVVNGDLIFNGGSVGIAIADGKMRLTNSLTLGGNTFGPAMRIIGRTNDDTRSLYVGINTINLGVVGIGSTAGALYIISGDGNITLRSGTTTMADFSTTRATMSVPVAVSLGTYYPSNTLTMATVVGNITNNGAWFGMISNCLMSVTMSNNAATWKQINP